MNYLLFFLSFFTAMILAMLVIPRILVIAVRHSLYDIPDTRKKHKGAVPRIGGVSFIPCILFSMMFTFGIFYMFADGSAIAGSYPNLSEFCLFVCAIILLYLGGIKDDLVGLRYRHKFLIQIIAALLIVFSGLQINHLHGLFGLHEIVWWVGIPLTVLIIVFIINAINLIDGMDGLASGISVFALCVYGTLFLLHGLWYYAVLAFSTIGVLVPFFYYNVFGDAAKKRKLFMGDSGSMSLGFILGFLAIRYTCSSPDVFVPIDNALVVAVSPLLVPMLDVLRVILIRLKSRRSPFQADRCHIHHKLLEMGLNKMTALILLLCISSGLCILNLFMMHYVNNLLIFAVDIVIWISVNQYFSYLIKKRRLHLHPTIKLQTPMPVPPEVEKQPTDASTQKKLARV